MARRRGFETVVFFLFFLDMNDNDNQRLGLKNLAFILLKITNYVYIYLRENR